jgi:two-component system KDP operon response regulator KdpE
LKIDPTAHQVTVPNKEYTSPEEFDLLVYLARRPGKVVSHRSLLGAIWGNSTEQVDYLRVFVGQLRKS